MKFCTTTFLVFLLSAISFADTIHVPGDQPTIQAGIDAAAADDVVLVAPGTYVENLLFNGKAITLTSSDGAKSTWIDGRRPNDPDKGSVISFVDGEGNGSILEGFTLTRGTGTLYYSPTGTPFTGGGGVYCFESSPTIRNVVFFDNLAENGGGVYSEDGDPIINDCVFMENDAIRVSGGGIDIFYGSVTIENCIFKSNRSRQYGGAIAGCAGVVTSVDCVFLDNWAHTHGGAVDICFDDMELLNCFFYNNGVSWGHAGAITHASGGVRIVGCGFFDNYCGMNGGAALLRSADPCEMVNCTFANNSAEDYGGALILHETDVEIANSIFWDNEAADGPEIAAYYKADLSINCCDLKGGTDDVHIGSFSEIVSVVGMINADPQFVDPSKDDYHLTGTSPCVDAGSNAAVTEPFDMEGDPRIAYNIVDMGADEFHPHLYCTGDFTPRGAVQCKLIGLPDTAPLGLFFGSGKLTSPIHHMWGDFFLEAPWYVIHLGVAIPSDGVLEIRGTIPTSPAAPYDVFMQALIGTDLNALTNPFTMEVR